MGDEGAFEEDMELADYVPTKFLGSGTFGKAFLAVDKRNGKKVAIKYMSKADFSPYVFREILIHQQLQHPSIARFIELRLTRTFIAIIMEAADRGDLFEYVFEKKGLNDQEAFYVFYQLVEGLAYMHAKGVAHRDIKLENILLSGDGNNPKVKLCDFGFSKRVGIDSICKTIAGTFTYVAPEVLEKESCRYDGASVDMWAAGVTLYAMTLMAYPFEHPKDPMNNVKTAERILNVEYRVPKTYSPELRSLLRSIFVPEPNERITAERLAKQMRRHLPDELLTQTEGETSVCIQSEASVRQMLNEVAKECESEEFELLNDVEELEITDIVDEGTEGFMDYKHGQGFSETLRSIRDITSQAA